MDEVFFPLFYERRLISLFSINSIFVHSCFLPLVYVERALSTRCNLNHIIYFEQTNRALSLSFYFILCFTSKRRQKITVQTKSTDLFESLHTFTRHFIFIHVAKYCKCLKFQKKRTETNNYYFNRGESWRKEIVRILSNIYFLSSKDEISFHVAKMLTLRQYRWRHRRVV